MQVSSLMFFGLVGFSSGGLLAEYEKSVKIEFLHRLDCSLTPEKSCPQDGGWSEWSDWSSCRGECGQVGLRERSRLCDSPQPSSGGLLCQGLSHEELECRSPGCTEADYEAMLEGDDIRSKELIVLKKVHEVYPSLRERCLEAECHLRIIESLLKSSAERYWDALHCVKHNSGCPELGGWSDWGVWSECSASCGQGQQLRCRSCDRPPPTFPSLRCPGENCTFRPCQGNHCAHNIGFLGGKWGSWSVWSECSASCGGGLKSRSRLCLEDIPVKEGSSTEGEECEAAATTTGGYFCSKYSFNRTRRKKSTSASVDLTFCQGSHVEWKPCFRIPCKVDGDWSEWEPWSPCSLACGLGLQSRSRACSSHRPRDGGSTCTGPVSHFRHCFLKPCSDYSPVVASFLGDGSLEYKDMGRNIRLLHIFIVFKPLKRSGFLIVRIPSEASKDYFVLSLVMGYIFLTASMKDCRVTLIHFKPIELGIWTRVLIFLTPQFAEMQINDEATMKQNFTCRPKLPNFRSRMIVGLNFTGQILKLHVNFLERHLQSPPRDMINPTNLYPYLNGNVEYEKMDDVETYRKLDELLLVPCDPNPNISIILVVKGLSGDGLLLFLTDESKDRSLVLSVEPRRIQLHYLHSRGVIETFQVVEPHLGLWIHLKIDYGGPEGDTWGLTVDGGKRNTIRKYSFDYRIDCSNGVLIGNVANVVKEHLGDNKIRGLNNESFNGLLGHIEVNGRVFDVSSLQGKAVTENGLERFAADAISPAEFYSEIRLEPHDKLELSCTYLNSTRNGLRKTSQMKPVWIWFNIPLLEDNFENNGKNLTISDDSAESFVTVLNYSSLESIEGFYSCWLPSGVLITYGVTVLDPSLEYSNVFRILLEVVWIAALGLLLATLIWLSAELIIGHKSREAGSGRVTKVTWKVGFRQLEHSPSHFLTTPSFVRWGLFSQRSLNKRIRRVELCNLSHDLSANLLLGVKRDITFRNEIEKEDEERDFIS